MDLDWLARMRARAEKKTVCMGMGGEERFVSHTDVVLSRKSVIGLLDWIETLQKELKEADQRAEYWRQELEIECDRLVFEWAERVRELEDRIEELEGRS